MMAFIIRASLNKLGTKNIIYFVILTLILNSLAIDLPLSISDNLNKTENNKSKLIHDKHQRIRDLINNEVSIEPIQGLYLHNLAINIASRLRTVSNEELGVTALQVRKLIIPVKAC
jgi:hypothetical protein